MTVHGFTGGSHAQLTPHREWLLAAIPDLIFSEMKLSPHLIAEHDSAGAKISDTIHLVDVDVGTASARARVFALKDEMLGRAEHDLLAICKAVKSAVPLSAVDPGSIEDIAFDDTCSFVQRGKSDEPVSAAISVEDRWDTISWLDHCALKEAGEYTATGHHVLTFLGRVMSPEMQTPTLMWLKRNLPSWALLDQVLDLADFLSWNATGSLVRSQCTLVCKRTYPPQDDGPWGQVFFNIVGLGEFCAQQSLQLKVQSI